MKLPQSGLQAYLRQMKEEQLNHREEKVSKTTTKGKKTLKGWELVGIMGGSSDESREWMCSSCGATTQLEFATDHELMLISTLQHTYVLNRIRIIDIFIDKNPILGDMNVLC